MEAVVIKVDVEKLNREIADWPSDMAIGKLRERVSLHLELYGLLTPIHLSSMSYGVSTAKLQSGVTVLVRDLVKYMSFRNETISPVARQRYFKRNKPIAEILFDSATSKLFVWSRIDKRFQPIKTVLRQYLKDKKVGKAINKVFFKGSKLLISKGTEFYCKGLQQCVFKRGFY